MRPETDVAFLVFRLCHCRSAKCTSLRDVLFILCDKNIRLHYHSPLQIPFTFVVFYVTYGLYLLILSPILRSEKFQLTPTFALMSLQFSDIPCHIYVFITSRNYGFCRTEAKYNETKLTVRFVRRFLFLEFSVQLRL